MGRKYRAGTRMITREEHQRAQSYAVEQLAAAGIELTPE
jgi:hypothetical protein